MSIRANIISMRRFGGKQLATSKLATQLGEEGGALSSALSWSISAGLVERAGQLSCQSVQGRSAVRLCYLISILQTIGLRL